MMHANLTNNHSSVHSMMKTRSTRSRSRSRVEVEVEFDEDEDECCAGGGAVHSTYSGAAAAAFTEHDD